LLETLRIQNYALIDALEIEFQPGFNVLTGETGAGKSIIVGALGLVLGGRASAEVVRSGVERAKVDAVFRLPNPSKRLLTLLARHDLSMEDGTLLLSRVVSADGRSRAYVAGSLVPIALLAEVGDELVDLHGQHEHQSLLKTERQMDLLDSYGETEPLAAQVQELVSELRRLEREIASLESDDRERTREMEFLRFEIGEIDDAELHPGEDQELKARIVRITNAETIFSLANQAYAAIYENDNGAAIDRLDLALKDLEELARIGQEFAELARRLSAVRGDLEDISGELRNFAERLEFDPQELDTLNARQALIGSLKRKYGGSVEEILAYRAQAADKVAAYEGRDERLETLRQQRDVLSSKALDAAQSLSRKRQAAAHKLDRQVEAALQDLGMKGARFETAFEAIGLGMNGVDRVSFLLSANPGEKLKPLKLVASGGEVSRIMLALKAVFAAADQIPALIFDEIDAGVGGAVARKVAEKLSGLAATHQVVCITHIPQIAAVARTHFTVTKQTQKNHTITQVSRVDDSARIHELARLLDGTMTDVSVEHARRLLAEHTTKQ
jgi:DNA repair protein RecN (Recombination protein N)